MFCGTFFSLKKFSICTFSLRFESKVCQNVFIQLLACVTLQGQVTEEELGKKQPKKEAERNTAVEKNISLSNSQAPGSSKPAELGLLPKRTSKSFNVLSDQPPSRVGRLGWGLNLQ